MSSETHSYVKSPTFDGKDENWPIFKRKMETYLARLDLTEVLDDSIVFPKDDEMGTTDDEKEKFKELKRKNRKAASTLLDSITSAEEKGKTAFFFIERCFSADDGFAGGHFRNAWNALIARYEKVQVKNLRDQKQEYYTERMGKHEQPFSFIVRMDRMRSDLKKLKYEISEEDFIQDILSKLPESKDMDNLTAFEVERKMIEKRIEDSSSTSPYSMDNLITDLERVFQEKQRNTKETNKTGEVGFYNTDEKKGGRTNNRKYKKQFKGTCKESNQD